MISNYLWLPPDGFLCRRLALSTSSHLLMLFSARFPGFEFCLICTWLLVSLLGSASAVAQATVVPLTKLDDFSRYSRTNLDSTQQFKNLPKDLRQYMLKYMVIGGLPGQPPAQRLNFLIGRDKQGQIVFIPAEPSTRTLRLKDKQVLPAVPGQPEPQSFQVQVRGLYGPLTLTMRPTVYLPKGMTITVPWKNDLFLALERFDDARGTLKVGNQEVMLRAGLSGSSGLVLYTDLVATIRVLDGQHEKREYKMGDSFMANGNLVTLRHISAGGDSLTVQVAEPAKTTRPYGFDAGFAFLQATLTDIKGQAVALAGTERPLVLDFWGTWCAPCVALTPSLKALHQQYAGQADIVSIALDDTDKVKQYLASNDIAWTNIAIPEKQMETSVIGKLHVHNYPTFILVYKGVIQYRGTGETGLKELTQQLSQLK
jgi:thiol-disulfide isomerase/thioredoxin